MFSLPCIHVHPFCDLAQGVGPGWSCGRVWLGRADPTSGKGSCLPEHSWRPHWNCYWFTLMWRWADLRPGALSDEVFPASHFRENIKPLWWGRKKKGFFFYLQTPPQNNMGERRIANIQWEILSSFFSSWRKKFPTQIKTRWSPGAPPADLREQREGRCLVVCQAFSTGLVALWCGTWSSRGLEPALQMQQELSWKRAS